MAPPYDDTEVALVRRAQGGDLDARNTLIERHIPFLKAQIRRAIRRCDPDEYLAIAVGSFIQKIGTYRHRPGGRLYAYAALGIAGDVKREAWRQSGSITVPRAHKKLSDRTQRAALAAQFPLSLNAPKGGGDDSPWDHPDRRDHDDAERHDEAEWLRRQIGRLPERMAAIMLGMLEHKTQAQIGKELGIGASRVCQLHTQAVGLLKILCTKDTPRVTRKDLLRSGVIWGRAAQGPGGDRGLRPPLSHAPLESDSSAARRPAVTGVALAWAASLCPVVRCRHWGFGGTGIDFGHPEWKGRESRRSPAGL